MLGTPFSIAGIGSPSKRAAATETPKTVEKPKVVSPAKSRPAPIVAKSNIASRLKEKKTSIDDKLKRVNSKILSKAASPKSSLMATEKKRQSPIINKEKPKAAARGKNVDLEFDSVGESPVPKTKGKNPQAPRLSGSMSSIKPLLYIDIDIGEGQKDRITVYKGDLALPLAQEFC